MFSKALFKQSCKANGTMWGIITFAVCFMLACVMLISGNGNIGQVKNSIQDTIITKEVDAQMEKRALTYYVNGSEGLEKFDILFSEKASDSLSYLIWLNNMPLFSDYQNSLIYEVVLKEWKNNKPSITTKFGEDFIINIESSMPKDESFTTKEEYYTALNFWVSKLTITEEEVIKLVYLSTCEDLQTIYKEKAIALGFEEDSNEANELLGCVMYTLNPNKMFDEFYLENNETVPTEYDYISLLSHIMTNDVESFINSNERINYRQNRTETSSAIFLAGNMSKKENVLLLTDALSSYGVTKEKFDSFGYTYDTIKHMAKTVIVTYQGRVDYELGLLKEKYEHGEYENDTLYLSAVELKKQKLVTDVSSSFLSTLPSTVSDALEEVGKADLYTLIVGSIFYKLAGLLLPIIYMIMASNNLIAGQVDSGSMAYVLSTSTKRRSVVFTQAVYLIGSLLAMFLLTTLTSCICLTVITEEVGLTYGNLLLLNLGAFLILFALSGLCFFTSCYFNRSKYSMAIGGGLSIFALVAAMLGLFGSEAIPSVVRLNALNNFNYVTIISLFDVISIINGDNVFIYKYIILALLGITGYIAGSTIFDKKDLPL